MRRALHQQQNSQRYGSSKYNPFVLFACHALGVTHPIDLVPLLIEQR